MQHILKASGRIVARSEVVSILAILVLNEAQYGTRRKPTVPLFAAPALRRRNYRHHKPSVLFFLALRN